MITKETNLNIAALFKSTRKFHRLQQTEFSAILGVTQGTISKVESGSMSPDLGLWFRFLRAFNIQDPYCFTYAGVEFDESAFSKLKKDGSPLAPAFDFSKENYVFNVRKIRPLYDFLIQSHNKTFETFLKSQKIAKEIFYILNHPLTVEFVDTFFAYMQEHKINEKSLALLNLNFDHSLGRQMNKLTSAESNEDLFNIINQDSDELFEYEFSAHKGEYFINLKKNIKRPEMSGLVMSYDLLYPYHVMKATNKIKASTPQVHEVKKDQRWQVVYA